MAAKSDPVSPPAKVIHVARILPKGNLQYLLLRKVDPQTYVWYRQEGNSEVETSISRTSAEEAIHQARRFWKKDFFRLLNCGFRYTLPERDEHGSNALFHQMIASYSSPNGIYFDEDLGHNCFVNFASQEARDLWETLKTQGRL